MVCLVWNAQQAARSDEVGIIEHSLQCCWLLSVWNFITWFFV